MGAVDLVVQVSSPGSVAAGLQRIGRWSQVGAQPGRIFPSTAPTCSRRPSEADDRRSDRDHVGASTSSTSSPRSSPRALGEWSADDLFTCVASANYGGLSGVFEATDMLAGRYPSEEFAELRPRWCGTARPAPSGSQLETNAWQSSGGTIPDCGLYGVFCPTARVGGWTEMVHESRAGETFLLGASTWRIEGHLRRVVVTPPGQPGRMPFWHGDDPGDPPSSAGPVH